VGAGNKEQDFWGELDTRVNTLGEQQKPLKSPIQDEGLPRRFKGKHAGVHNHPSHVGDELAKPDHSAPPPTTKKSRFDREVQHLDNRRNRKNSRQQASRFVGDDEWDDDGISHWDRQQEKKAEKEARKKREAEVPKTVPIFLPEFISAANLAQALKQRPSGFLLDMEEMGFENVTSDTIMTGDTAALIAMEYGFEPTVDTGSKRDLRPAPFPEDISSLPSRPPVVTIMGHVDHGKTTLLDWLRKSSVAAQEHGGITQHIGAFVVQMSSGKQITFLDTPGHAAFLSMRQRGANVTDIVVLVVAADDSVKPQTLEALKHAKAAKVPIIVAINKIDKEDARIDQVKADLSRNGVEIEDYGGDVQVVCVSGKTGQGMPDLEENILTLSEVLDVRAPADGMAEGWVLESSVKQDGKTATVLVKRGVLRAGDIIAAGETWARIRLLRNEAGVEIAEAPPGTPVEILGWRELPTAGELMIQAPDEGTAKTAIEYRLEKAEREENSAQVAEQEQRLREKAAAEAVAEAAAAKTSEDAAKPAEPSILTQNFVVKADVAGSVEAVCGSILEQGNNEVCAKVLRSSAGQITEYDVDHASVSKSIIVNFNSTIQPHIKHRAEEAKVKILDHTVIYHVVDDVRNALSDLLPMTVTHRVSGEADILQMFQINIKKRVYRNIAGCRVRNGAVRKGSMVKVLRKGKVVHIGKLFFFFFPFLLCKSQLI
jgi:translation initiation factor IF-2